MWTVRGPKPPHTSVISHAHNGASSESCRAGEAVPLGTVGRLHVRCPYLFRGYWTAEGVSHEPGAHELYRTGDLVRWVPAEDGARIAFCGRESGSHIKVRPRHAPPLPIHPLHLRSDRACLTCPESSSHHLCMPCALSLRPRHQVRGFKLFPELIESEINKHPDVASSWVSAVGEDDATARLEAAIELKQGAKLDSAALRAWLSTKLPQYAHTCLP